MNDYMRENKIDEVWPQLAGRRPPPSPARKPTASARRSRPPRAAKAKARDKAKAHES